MNGLLARQNRNIRHQRQAEWTPRSQMCTGWQCTIYNCSICTYGLYTAGAKEALLVKNNRSNLPRNVSIAHKVTQFAALRVALDKNNPLILLLANRHQGTSLVHGKLTRVPAAAGSLLYECEATSLAIDGEVDERIGGDVGAVLAVEVGDGEGVVAAGGNNQKLGIRLPIQHIPLVSIYLI